MSSTIATSGRRLAIASSSLRIPQNSSGPGNWVVDRPIAAATRSTTAAGSSVPSDRAPSDRPAILPSATSRESSSPYPAAFRTISAIGQNVTPSPYGRQRPRRTCDCARCAEARSANSRTSRDLPDARVADDREQLAGAGGGRPRAAQSRAASSPTSRPTNGVVGRRPLAADAARPLTSRYAATGSALPLRVSGGIGSTSIWSRARR